MIKPKRDQGIGLRFLDFLTEADYSSSQARYFIYELVGRQLLMDNEISDVELAICRRLGDSVVLALESAVDRILNLQNREGHLGLEVGWSPVAYASILMAIGSPRAREALATLDRVLPNMSLRGCASIVNTALGNRDWQSYTNLIKNALDALGPKVDSVSDHDWARSEGMISDLVDSVLSRCSELSGTTGLDPGNTAGAGRSRSDGGEPSERRGSRRGTAGGLENVAELRNVGEALHNAVQTRREQERLRTERRATVAKMLHEERERWKPRKPTPPPLTKEESTFLRAFLRGGRTADGWSRTLECITPLSDLEKTLLAEARIDFERSRRSLEISKAALGESLFDELLRGLRGDILEHCKDIKKPTKRLIKLLLEAISTLGQPKSKS